MSETKFTKPKPYAWLCEREKCVLHPRIFYSGDQAKAWAEAITVNPPVKITPVYTRAVLEPKS